MTLLSPNNESSALPSGRKAVQQLFGDHIEQTTKRLVEVSRRFLLGRLLRFTDVLSSLRFLTFGLSDILLEMLGLHRVDRHIFGHGPDADVGQA